MKIALQLKARLENLEYLATEGDDFRWYLKLKCLNCGEISDRWIYACLNERASLKGGRGEASVVLKCKLCSRENSIDIIKEKLGKYTSDNDSQYSTVVAFECRGLEPVDFSPRVGFIAAAEGSGTLFNDINLEEKEWVDYDEKGNQSVAVYELQHQFKKL